MAQHSSLTDDERILQALVLLIRGVHGAAPECNASDSGLDSQPASDGTPDNDDCFATDWDVLVRSRLPRA
jgi:hypothetical protein